MDRELSSTTAIRPPGRGRDSNRLSEGGVSLIEAMAAAVILTIVAVGLMPVFVLGFQTNEQQGDIATRTTEYAQDKMESLFNLSFTDGATNTTVYPATSTGGTGLGGAMTANSTVGSIPPTASVAGYVDYLDSNGNLLTSSTGAYYTRDWSISTDSTNTLKTITVFVTSLQAAGIKGLAPSTKLVCMKSSAL
jgi:hypothetical protein